MRKFLLFALFVSILAGLYLMLMQYRRIALHTAVPIPAPDQVPLTVSESVRLPESSFAITNRIVRVPEPVLPSVKAVDVQPQTNRKVQVAVPGQIRNEHVLSFYSVIDRDKFIKESKANGATILDVMPFGNSVRCRVDSQETLERILKTAPTPIEQSPNLVVRYPEQERRTAPVPLDDENYVGFGNRSLGWLGVSGDNSKWGSGVTIAVLDTGVAKSSTLQEANITRRDFLDLPADAEGEGAGHATAVASIIAGNGVDVKGVSPSAGILSYRVLDGAGSGDSFTMAKALVDAVDSGARVINICAGSESDSHIMKGAVGYAIQKGVLIVASAGNDGSSHISYPAGYDGVISVGAVDAQGAHANFSNTGAKLSVSAPGIGVATGGVGDEKITFSGTSAAAPFVSGTLGALISECPDLSPGEVADLVRKYADDVGKPGKDEEYGYGILNISRILNRNQNGVYDVSMADLYTVPGPADAAQVKFIAYAQNRGTEPLDELDMRVQISEQNHQMTFRDIGVGGIAQYEFSVDRSRLGNDIREIRTKVSLPGQPDADPKDNARTFMFEKRQR